MKKPTAFLFFGKSGSGKGTQAKLLQAYLEKADPSHPTLVVSTGEKFRGFIQGDSHTSAIARDILSTGDILPVHMSVWMWTQWLVDNFTGAEHVIIDGLARKAHEVPVLAEALESYGLVPAYVFELAVSDEEVTKRLLARRREDDTEERIKRRLSWFETEVRGSLDAFEKDDRFQYHVVDGGKPAEETHAQIVAAIGASK